MTAWRARDQDELPVGGIDLLWLAALRAALVPVVLLGEQLVDHPVEHTGAFPFLLAAFGLWAAALLALRLAVRRGAVAAPAVLDRVEPFVDLAAIVALTYASGGPFSETAMAFFVLPVLAAARLRPRLTAGWALGAIVAYILLSVVHPTAGEDQATARMISQVALPGVDRARRDAGVERPAPARGGNRQAGQATWPARRPRARLRAARAAPAGRAPARRIGADTVARPPGAGRLPPHGSRGIVRARAHAIDETMAQIRGEIFELHPYVLDHAGLPAALRAIADRSAARMGAEITVAVDPAGIGHHDELIVVLTRELLTNAAKHSGASHVAVTVAADHERIELEVRDDGDGFDPARREAALLDGHVGLASSEQRVRSAGGELIVSSVPGRGTTVQAVLPADG